MHYDIAVVGAGIVGLSHAFAAAKRGLQVIVFERDPSPVGASIRNFGHAQVTGQAPGEMLQLARQSRALWQQFAKAANLALRQEGTLVVARTTTEQQLLEAFAHGRGATEDYDCRLLTRQQLGQLYGGYLDHHLMALHGRLDQVIYAREAIVGLLALLQTFDNVRICTSTQVNAIDADSGALNTSRGRHHAEHLVVCSGHDYQTLLAAELRVLKPSVCRLQMLRVRPREPFALRHAIMTGLSCVHYGAFADLPEAAAVAAEIKQQTPELLQYGIHLLVTPTPHGDLIIGDSHDYGECARPFNSETVNNLLLQLASQTLQCQLDVKERWQGVYGARGEAPISVLQPHDRVTAVLMRTGLGMSVGPALGERTIANILGELPIRQRLSA